MVADFILSNVEKTRAMNEVFKHVYRCFPHYNLGKGLIQLSMKSFVDRLMGSESSCFDWKVSVRVA